MNALTVTYRNPLSLKPRDKNPRTHSKKQIRQIARSIKEFGFLTPILIDSEGAIIAGHGRWAAAKLIGMNDIPTVEVSHLTATQVRAYVVADNELAAKAGWDRELLAFELKELSLTLDFDATLTGFETAEIDRLMLEIADEDDPEKDVPDVDRNIPSISKPGDLWVLGNHRILCGDATLSESYEKLLENHRAQMVFTDVPYNVPINGHVSGLGTHTHPEFQMASGEMSPEEFIAFLRNSFKNFASFSSDGAIHAICMDWRHVREILDASSGIYAELKNICVWVKTNGGMGSLYRSQHEFVFIFKSGTAAHINNIELGKHGRNRTNVWAYAGANTFSKRRDSELAMHPTVKPLALVTDAIMDCSHRNGIVLDAFAGSGTTLIAAERSGRRGFGIEIDPYYVDTILMRFRKTFGIEPTLGNSDQTFSSIQHARGLQRSNANVQE